MVLGSRRVLPIGFIGWWVDMVAVRMVRGMRFRMIITDVPVRRDLKQVQDSQGQDDARPERAMVESQDARFHDRGKLAANAPGVNLSSV